MTTIYKYGLYGTTRPTVTMPEGAMVLSARALDDHIFIWALVDPDAPITTRRFLILGTGRPTDDCLGQFVDTVQHDGGALIFHVWDLGEGE